MPTEPLSRECRLVFRTAGGRAAEASAVAALDEGPIDWARVLLLSEREVAGAAVWHALERHGAAQVHPEIVTRFRRHAMVSDFRMMHLSQRLQRTVQALVAHGVPVMLLKGAAIGASTDPTFRSRPMNDIDILVRPDDLARAVAAIADAGWPPNRNRRLESLLQDHHHLPPFFDDHVPDLRLELHVALLPTMHSFTLTEDEVWRDAVAAPAPFAGALIPSAEHLLFHACTHFAWSHTMHFGLWRTAKLASAVIEGGALDWERFVALAMRARGRGSCYWTLELARRVAGVEVPRSVLERLAVPPQEWLREALARTFIAGSIPGEGVRSPSQRLSRLLWLVAMRPGAGEDGRGGHWKHLPTPAHGQPAIVGTPESLLRRVRGLRRWWTFATQTFLTVD